MVIHTFGDSHCSKQHGGWPRIDSIADHHVSSLLCYTFGTSWQKRCNLREFNIQDGDTVVFCLGEIDCRCHIYKHITPTVTYKQIIDSIVAAYIAAIKANVSACGKHLKRVCIYNVPPPANRDTSNENKNTPFMGSNEERKSYTVYFNEKLKEGCVANGFTFIDIYAKYCDADGHLNRVYSDGHVHIKDGRYIEEYIKNNLL